MNNHSKGNTPMKFKLTIEVDIEALQQTYRKGLGLSEQDEIPDIDELVVNEMSWVALSGITPIDIEEVKENVR